MVIDTSAILAVLLNEENAVLYNKQMARECRKFICPFNALEADFVITSRYGSSGKEQLDRYIFSSGIEIIPYTSGIQALAYDTWLKFGKGRHKAKLNMGDCWAYATAKALNEPLLFKGEDFSLTDIRPVLKYSSLPFVE